MTYCHFTDDGRIVDDTDFLQQHFATGMGQYEASWPKIEAEWFYEKSPEVKKQDCAEGGFEITDIQNGSWLRFANLNFETGVNTLEVRGASPGSDAQIEVRRDSPSGPLLGSLSLPNSGGTNLYQTFTGHLQDATGTQDIYLKFTGGPGNLVRMNWIRFSTQNIPFQAHAGLDQTITDFDCNGIERVTLDGSGSFGGANTITNYVWLADGTMRATGANPTINLSIGTHAITLVVTDSLGGTASDAVIVTVLPFRSPTSAILYSELTDSAPRSDGTIIISTANDNTLFVGRAGSGIGLDRSPVLVFRLPDLGEVANPFSSASFRVEYASNHLGSPTTANVDLYGLGNRASAVVLGSDYYGESSLMDSSDATSLQVGFLNTGMISNNSGFGVKTTNLDGDAALRDYLNTQYASGAGRLNYVSLRLSSQAAMPLNVRYVITSANGANNLENETIWPQIQFAAFMPYPDIDMDRMPDQWEMQSFNTLAKSTVEDTDNDGQPNAAEYLSGTDPTDPHSHFKVKNLTQAVGGGFTICWESVNGRIYTVFRSTDVATDSWSAAISPQAGTGAEMFYTIPESGSATRAFFRVGVSFP